jgi:hypothetical protein
MSDRYVIVSSDCHAGLPCEEYRPYLDTKYHRQFDEFLAERTARREEALRFNYDYIMQIGSRTTKRGYVAPSIRSSGTRSWTPMASPAR